MKILEHSCELTKAGLSAIPIRTDGTKAAAVKWEPYQSKIADTKTLHRWFGNDHKYGIGVICGEVSGDLEVLDIDEKHELGITRQFLALLKTEAPDLDKKLTVRVKTPTKGMHVYYRCTGAAERGKKLARNAAKVTTIETRGEGQYVIAPGSPPECHEVGVPYEFCLSANPDAIPVITPEEREIIHCIASSLSEYVEPEKTYTFNSVEGSNRPGDSFNRQASWEEILEPHDFVKIRQDGDVGYWRRPGKDGPGWSATTDHIEDRLYVFSTNAEPFEAGATYDKFSAYAYLNHDADFSTAASDLVTQGYGEETSFVNFVSFVPSTWPDPLREEAFYGLAGDFTRLVEPHTESDPAALLTQFLVYFGNCVGRNTHFRVEADFHYQNEFMVLVGETARGRKGTSRGHVHRVFDAVDIEWVENRIQDGLSSGEGLIWAVRDSIEGWEKSTEGEYQSVIRDPGLSDKRLLVCQGEFGAALKVMRREGNTLSPVVRNAWDTGSLNTLVKNNPAKVTGAHISIIGHITRQELLRYMDDTEAANGFGNRFLWVCSRRSKLLPEGGNLDKRSLKPIIDRLAKALGFARTAGRIQFDEQARAIWWKIYPQVSRDRPGLYGAVTARAEAHVIRLACIYALLDCSKSIRPEHLRAALAVWDYCEESCRYIFGGSLGDPIADDILKALRKHSEGMARTAINNLFKRNKSSQQITRALNVLEGLGLARPESKETGGRKAELWFATSRVTK